MMITEFIREGKIKTKKEAREKERGRGGTPEYKDKYRKKGVERRKDYVIENENDMNGCNEVRKGILVNLV